MTRSKEARRPIASQSNWDLCYRKCRRFGFKKWFVTDILRSLFNIGKPGIQRKKRLQGKRALFCVSNVYVCSKTQTEQGKRDVKSDLEWQPRQELCEHYRSRVLLGTSKGEIIRMKLMVRSNGQNGSTGAGIWCVIMGRLNWAGKGLNWDANIHICVCVFFLTLKSEERLGRETCLSSIVTAG